MVYYRSGSINRIPGDSPSVSLVERVDTLHILLIEGKVV